MKIHAVLHVHSHYSYDGKLSLSEIKNHAQKNGVTCVFMSEHADELSTQKGNDFIDECRKLSSRDFIFIPGIEVSYEGNHILCYGIKKYEKKLASLEMMKDFFSDAAILVWAHPHRGSFAISEEIKKMLTGIEVWNSQYDGKYAPRTRSLSLYKKSEIPFAFAGIDFHRLSHWGGPHLEIETNDFSEIALKESLKNGQYILVGGWNCIDSKLKNINIVVKILNQISSIFFIALIVFFKSLNSFFVKSGIRFPKKIKELLRKII